MAECGGISAASIYDCESPLVPGLNSRVWLGNYKDITSLTYDVTDKRLVTAIVFETGGAVYKYEGTRQSNNATSEFVPQSMSVGFKHIIDLRVFGIDSAAKAELEKMCLSKVFAIVEHPNAEGNGNSVFEIFGPGVGMEVITLGRISRDNEGQSSYALQLGTSDAEGQESTLPLSLLDTDYATTLALITGYETPAV